MVRESGGVIRRAEKRVPQKTPNILLLAELKEMKHGEGKAAGWKKRGLQNLLIKLQARVLGGGDAFSAAVN